MTVSLLQLQLQQQFHCSAVVYIAGRLAGPFDTLLEAGFQENGLVEFSIDQTMSLREFEEELEDKYNLTLELTDTNDKPIIHKGLRLFQLLSQSEEHSGKRNLIEHFEFLEKWFKDSGSQPALGC